MGCEEAARSPVVPRRYSPSRAEHLERRSGTAGRLDLAEIGPKRDLFVETAVWRDRNAHALRQRASLPSHLLTQSINYFLLGNSAKCGVERGPWGLFIIGLYVLFEFVHNILMLLNFGG